MPAAFDLSSTKLMQLKYSLSKKPVNDWFFGIIEGGEKNADREEGHRARRGRNDVYGAAGAAGAPATQDRRSSE